MGDYPLKNKADIYRRINLKVYAERLVSMMKDYDITLKEAISWDMEGFGNYNPSLVSHIHHYLVANGLHDTDDRLFYVKVMRGLVPDFKLSKLENSNDTSRNF